jgi:hypothetical protein
MSDTRLIERWLPIAALRLARAVGVDIDKDIVGSLVNKKGSDLIMWNNSPASAPAPVRKRRLASSREMARAPCSFTVSQTSQRALWRMVMQHVPLISGFFLAHLPDAFDDIAEIVAKLNMQQSSGPQSSVCQFQRLIR